MSKSIFIRKILKKSHQFPIVNVNLVISHVDPDTLYGKNFKSEKKVGLNFSGSHVTVCIGPWKFAWFDHSLVVPTLQNGIQEAEFCFEIGKYELSDENIKKIAQDVCDWNFNRYYASFENSWDFAESFLKFLGFNISEISMEGELKRVCERLQKRIYNTKTLDLPEGLIENTKKVTFKNHKELDEFLHELLKKHKDFEKEYPEHWKVLKGYDQAFWLRHIKVRRDLEDLDEDFETPENCFFGDPRVQGSYLSYNRNLTKEKLTISQ